MYYNNVYKKNQALFGIITSILQIFNIRLFLQKNLLHFYVLYDMIHLLTKMKRIVDYKIPKKAVVFLSRKSRIVASSVLLLMTILLFSRCDYSTKVISSAEPPDTVFNTFFDALKEKDFVKADACLANGATISPQNETDYGFFDTYVNTSLDLLRCESVGEPVYNGMNASVDVRLVSIDSKTFVSWMEKNYLNIEHDYLKNKKIAEIDTTNPEDISKLMSFALEKYAKKDKGITHKLRVNFVFSNEKWGIIGDDELVKAIFGGYEHEEENKDSQKKSD